MAEQTHKTSSDESMLDKSDMAPKRLDEEQREERAGEQTVPEQSRIELAGKDARQGEIALKHPESRRIFVAGLASIVGVVAVAGFVALAA